MRVLAVLALIALFTISHAQYMDEEEGKNLSNITTRLLLI